MLDEAYVRKDQQRRDALDWLDAVSSDSEYDIYVRDRVEASCTWILEREEYREWKYPTYVGDGPEVLWVYGKAGMGKTFLSARIIEDLKQTSSLPAVYFFATHEDSRKMEPLSILRSWIFQLASTRVCAFEELQKIRRRKDGRKATESDLWSLFSSCLQRIGRCFLLVDGYDELSNQIIPGRARVEGAREAFLKDVFQYVHCTKAHIAFISRDEVDIRRQILEAHPKTSVCIHTCCICSEDTAKDILSFSRRVVNDRLKGSEVDFKEEIVEKLSERCQGMFLLVRLCGATLYPGRNAAQLRDDMSEAPKKLSEAFDRDLRNISNLVERERKRAIEILRWTLFATRPLSVLELSEAILIDPENETFNRSDFPDCIDDDYIDFQILRICGSLIEFRPDESVNGSLRYERGTIHLTHFSIKEFLQSENTLGIRFDEHENQGRLATSCLYYLRSQDTEKFYLSEEPKIPHSCSVRDFSLWLQTPYKAFKKVRVFLTYAVLEWLKHIRTYEHLNKQLLPALKVLLSRENETQFRSWLFCYSAETETWFWKESRTQSILPTITSFGLLTGVRYFVEERKTDIDIKYPTGLNALWEAARDGNADMVSLLFELFDHSQWRDDKIAFDRVFENAAVNDHAVVFDIFSKQGFNLEDRSYLIWLYGQFNIMRWLLDHGVNPDVIGPGSDSIWDHMTLLQYHTGDYFGSGETKHAKLLLDRRADVNFPRTPPVSKNSQPSGGKGRNLFLYK